MIRWSMRKLPNGEYEGMLTLVPVRDVGPGTIPRGKPIKLKAQSKTKAGALLKASEVANQLVANPILQAAMPPGTGAAVKAVTALAQSAAAGKVGKVLKKLKGPGAKRIAKALKFW